MPGKPFRTQNLGAAKMTFEQVREIRRLYAAGWTQARLCREFDLGTAAIGKIVRRESWRHMPKTEEELRAEEKESEARFLERLRAEGLLPPVEALAVDIAAERARAGAGDRALDEAAGAGGPPGDVFKDE